MPVDNTRGISEAQVCRFNGKANNMARGQGGSIMAKRTTLTDCHNLLHLCENIVVKRGRNGNLGYLRIQQSNIYEGCIDYYNWPHERKDVGSNPMPNIDD